MRLNQQVAIHDEARQVLRAARNTPSSLTPEHFIRTVIENGPGSTAFECLVQASVKINKLSRLLAPVAGSISSVKDDVRRMDAAYERAVQRLVDAGDSPVLYSVHLLLAIRADSAGRVAQAFGSLNVSGVRLQNAANVVLAEWA